MQFHQLPNELVQKIFRSCSSIDDVFNLASTCHRFHKVSLHSSQKLIILSKAAEAQFGPLQDAIQVVTHNKSQAVHLMRDVPISIALLKQITRIGRVANRYEDIYPSKKWKHRYDERRLLSTEERYRLRRAIYRIWLYDKAFHNSYHPRESRNDPIVTYDRMRLLFNWDTRALAEIEDVRFIMRDLLENQICPSNGTIMRKFRKRFPDSRGHQLLFNIQIKSEGVIRSHVQVTPANKAYTKFHPGTHYELGAEGWGDEIPHYYVVEDMLKLDPGQILWLRDNAPLKGQVKDFVGDLGDWFDNNGETFAQTLGKVVVERGGDWEDFKDGINDGEGGIIEEVQAE
jgi:F-box domain